MSLSKLTSPSYSNINWRLVGIASLVAVGGGFCYYWKFSQKSEEGKKEILVEDEDEAKTLKENGNKLFKLGKYEAAIQNYTKAIELLLTTPDDKQEQLEQLYQNRAAVHEKLGDYKSVISETSLALRLNPKYVKALHRRSRSYKLTGFLDEALEDITAVCILEGFQSATSVQLADDILREVGAQEGMKLMKDRKPTTPSAHSVSIYLRGFWNCPIAKSFRSYDEDSKMMKCLKSGDYDRVLELCSQEIESTNSIEAYHLRGTLRFLYGYAQETLEDLNHVIEAECSKEIKATALIKRASYFALIDEEEKCESSFEQAQIIWNDNVDLWHHKGQVLLTRSNLQTALEYMTKAVELEPEYGIAVATKWYVQYRLAGFVGDVDEQARSSREFQKLLKKFPQSPDVFSLYGQILMENQSFEEAEIHFTKVLELDPKNASVVVHKAMSRFQRTMNTEEAIDMLKDALKIDERNEFIYETLGTLHLQIGNLEGASMYITKALSLARSFQELTILSSLKKAAEVQQKVKEKLNISAPILFNGK